MRAAPATLATLLLACACVGPPPARRPPLQTEVPDAWTARRQTPAAAEPRSDWWEDFEEPALSEAVRQALERNHDLRAAAARVEQAVAQAKIAGADLQPRANLGLNRTSQRQVFVGFPVEAPAGAGTGDPPEVLSSNSTSYGASLNVSWEADLWGRLRAGARAAVADLQAARADYEAARLSLAGQTAKAWLAAAAAAEQVDLARRTVESWRRSYEQLRERYDQGLRSPLDVRLALSNLANAEALLERTRRAQDAAVRQMETLLGRYPGRDLPEPSPLPALPAAIPGGLPADLVSRRPDLAAAERRLAAADQRYLSARRALYPQLTLTGSRGAASEDIADLLDRDFWIRSLVGGLVQPLFQGGRLRANVDRTTAAGQEALEAYVAAALRAYGEVETALAAEGYLERRDDRLQEAVRQAAAARELAESRYRSGLEDYVTVLESQRRELASDTELLLVRQSRLENRVDLYLALGGGFGVPGPAAGTGETGAAVRTSAELEP